MPEIRFQLNGQDVTADAAESLLDICKRLNIEVPHLCQHPDQRADGNCRACVVEIEGERSLAPSCRRTAQPGMVVNTDSQRARRAQQGVLQLLNQAVSTQRYRNDDELQEWSDKTGLPPVLQAEPVDERQDSSHPAIDFHADACILCTRCVRACREVQHNNIIGLSGRGS